MAGDFLRLIMSSMSREYVFNTRVEAIFRIQVKGWFGRIRAKTVKRYYSMGRLASLNVRPEAGDLMRFSLGRTHEVPMRIQGAINDGEDMIFLTEWQLINHAAEVIKIDDVPHLDQMFKSSMKELGWVTCDRIDAPAFPLRHYRY